MMCYEGMMSCFILHISWSHPQVVHNKEIESTVEQLDYVYNMSYGFIIFF